MTKKLIYLYSIFIAFLPVLNIYQSGVPLLNLAELLLILFLAVTILVMLMKKNVIFGAKKIVRSPLLFFVSFVFLTCISILLNDNGIVSLIDISNRFLRLFVWALTVTFTGYYLFNFHVASKWIIRIAFIATVFIIIQYLFWQTFNVYIPSVINNSFIKPVYGWEFSSEEIKSIYETRLFFRPASFFSEPAAYSYYAILALVLLLFESKVGSKKKMWSHYL
jgi:hypothetical protein